MRFLRNLALLFAFLGAPLAQAWGPDGHRITGLVAGELLTAKARIRLNQLVPGINLADYANQMDVFRTALSVEIPGSEKWHYDNRPMCAAKDYAEYCAGGHCASAKIPVYFKVLADESAKDEARAQAAMFLIHMVGDIHQPLHTTDDSDLGGNQKNVLVPGIDTPRNLHRAWDSELVRRALRGTSEADYVALLLARYRGGELKAWQSGEVADWMGESYLLAQSHVYGRLPEFTCGVPWPMDKVVPLPASYADAAAETIHTQLAKAGARIAWLLNRALDPQHGAGKP
ncbi:MAG TPA: S1/P1 nuclease [Usitatibacteraceae bacterium]|nr:S1/P1 nuclease [Usitatibacteraceae bacterium]